MTAAPCRILDDLMNDELNLTKSSLLYGINLALGL